MRCCLRREILLLPRCFEQILKKYFIPLFAIKLCDNAKNNTTDFCLIYDENKGSFIVGYNYSTCLFVIRTGLKM